jgi:two-component system, OmpR family, heavy metal sensor histidine kinase CusS
VPVSDSDREFVELLQVFNQTMERLERSFTQASRFSADAAHELKTPLSILQGELGQTAAASGD